MMKREYSAPRLSEYGQVHEVTLGASGSSPDAILVGGVLSNDISNPTCINNVGSGYCYVSS